MAFEALVAIKDHLSGEEILSSTWIDVYREIIKRYSKESLFFFAKYVLGFDLLTEQTHKKWADKLQVDFWKFNFFLRMKPRKTYKTTLYAEAFILWLWVKISPQLHIFYTSANSTLISEVSAHLDYYLDPDGGSLFQFIFGICRDPSITPNTSEVFNINGKDRSVKGSSLMMRTAGGSTNGVHPHIIIVDDPMDKNDRESQAVRRSKERWYDSLFPLLSPFRLERGGEVLDVEKLMFITTRWHMDDLVNYIIWKNREIEREDERFDIESEAIYNEDGSPRYPEFFPEEKIRKIRNQISAVFFACQYMNNPLPEGLQVFELERLHFFDPFGLDISQGRNVCLLDPSKGKKEGDFPAVIWINVQGKVVHIIDAIDDKIQIEKMLKLIARRNIEYGIPEMYYESNGTLMLTKVIKDIHAELDPNFRISVNEMTESRNKEERIVNMQPVLYNGTVKFRSDYKTAYGELMNQVVFYPAWGNDDFPDIIEKAAKIFTKPKFEFTRIEGNGVVM